MLEHLAFNFTAFDLSWLEVLDQINQRMMEHVVPIFNEKGMCRQLAKQMSETLTAGRNLAGGIRAAEDLLGKISDKGKDMAAISQVDEDFGLDQDVDFLDLGAAVGTTVSIMDMCNFRSSGSPTRPLPLMHKHV